MSTNVLTSHTDNENVKKKYCYTRKHTHNNICFMAIIQINLC